MEVTEWTNKHRTWTGDLIDLFDTRKIVEHKFCCPDIPDHVVIAYAEFSSIFGEVVCTGSRAIGGWKEDSDYDFVVAVDGESSGSWWDSHAIQIYKRLGAIWTCLWKEKYHDGRTKLLCIKTTDYKQPVNLIIDFRGRKMLENWMIATDAAIERCAMTRDERVKIFEEMGT
jgi:hypothetical protein